METTPPVEGDHLVAEAEGQATFVLRPMAEHVFGAAADQSIRFTFAATDGMIRNFVFEQNGAKFNATRRP